MRTAVSLALLMLLLLATVSCGGESVREPEPADPGVDTATPENVRLAVAIATEIDDDPEQAEAILEKHGMTEESFEALMYEIAADPALSKAYQAARGE